jgi:hypothetical protein
MKTSMAKTTKDRHKCGNIPNRDPTVNIQKEYKKIRKPNI